jgi:hypothetical protein
MCGRIVDPSAVGGEARDCPRCVEIVRAECQIIMALRACGICFTVKHRQD